MRSPIAGIEWWLVIDMGSGVRFSAKKMMGPMCKAPWWLLIALLCSKALAVDDPDGLRLEGVELLAQDGPVLVQRDDVVLTTSDLAGFLATIPMEHRWGFVQSRDQFMRSLENLLLEQALIRESVAAGLHEDFEIMAQVSSLLRSELARRFVVQQFAQAQLDSYETQARELFLADPSAFRSEDAWSFRHVLLTVPDPTGELQVVDSIKHLHKRIAGGELTLEQAALQYSEDVATQADGGLMVNIRLNQLDEAFGQVLAGLSVGEVSSPVRSQFGWHLIELVERREGAIPEFEDVRMELEERARDRHRETFVDRMLSDLFSRGGVVDDEALDAFLEEYFEGLFEGVAG